MKVVWLCHFVNKEMKLFFNTPHVLENSQWINNMIELFRERTDIELHLVAPNVFTNKRQEIYQKNIYYHFYQHRPNYIPKIVSDYLSPETLTNYSYVKKRIEKIIKDINPDIIHLHGAESPYYSAGILPLIKHFPILVTVQGFIRNTSERNRIVNKRIQIEEKILRSIKHVGVRTKDMSEITLKLNPNAQLHFHSYPMTMPAFIKESNIEAKFDIVFFARIVKDKGIEDLLEALVLVKKTKPDVSLQVIGAASRSYLWFIKNKIKKLDIEDNVKFLGFMESQQDIFQHAIHAKITVLPTYHDIIPGTIIESMFMKLPVIAYSVGGIPELNDRGQVVVLVEKQNIQQLANEIICLLNDKSKRDSLAESAFIYAQERFMNNNSVEEIMEVYNEILSE